MSDINKVLYRAYLDGLVDRKCNPAEYDEQVENYFIWEAFNEGVSHRALYGSLQSVEQNLAERAKWGKLDRKAATSFLTW